MSYQLSNVFQSGPVTASLRINPKLGGINLILDPGDRGADFLRESTIILGMGHKYFNCVQLKSSVPFIGADVMHPAPHTIDKPSYASVVGSVDTNAVKYVASSQAQTGRKEEILNLKEMCLVSLDRGF